MLSAVRPAQLSRTLAMEQTRSLPSEAWVLLCDQLVVDMRIQKSFDLGKTLQYYLGIRQRPR
jgi:hypothetical protein